MEDRHLIQEGFLEEVMPKLKLKDEQELAQ